MAAAGVSYHVGREANSVYGEQWNGVQTEAVHHGHDFHRVNKTVSAYVKPGDPKSGVLPRISTEPPGEIGQGDKKIQAYCYRMCLTDHPENRVSFSKPAGYDAKQYELMLRIFQGGWRTGRLVEGITHICAAARPFNQVASLYVGLRIVELAVSGRDAANGVVETNLGAWLIRVSKAEALARLTGLFASRASLALRP